MHNVYGEFIYNGATETGWGRSTTWHRSRTFWLDALNRRTGHFLYIP